MDKYLRYDCTRVRSCSRISKHPQSVRGLHSRTVLRVCPHYEGHYAKRLEPCHRRREGRRGSVTDLRMIVGKNLKMGPDLQNDKAEAGSHGDGARCCLA